MNYCTRLRIQLLDVILAMCFLEVLNMLTMYICSMSIMLKICEDFSKEYDILFNSIKTHLIIYDEIRKNQKMVSLCLNGESLHIQRVATHLCHPVGIDIVYSIAIRNATRDLIWRTNYVMGKLVFCSADVRAFMFHTYCPSYYGSLL